MSKVLSKDYLYSILKQIIELRKNRVSWKIIAEKLGENMETLRKNYQRWKAGEFKDFPIKYDTKIHYTQERITKVNEIYPILEQIIELRNSKEYWGASWEDIAEKLGRNVGTIKHYYYKWKRGEYKVFPIKYNENN